MQKKLHCFINNYWYGGRYRWLSFILVPFSIIYLLIISFRKKLYQYGLLSSVKLPVPVIVVGNITVGGTGKTPVVCSVVSLLKQAGYSPGVVSRGYAGKRTDAMLLHQGLKASEVGDEPLWLYQTLACPTAIGRDRVQAAQLLIQAGCNVIVSDDGLQHYHLKRDIELALIDGQRLFGNQRLLPAGPLREPLQRLQTVSFILVNQSDNKMQKQLEQILAEKKIQAPVFSVELKPVQWRHLSSKKVLSLVDIGQETVHAVAGIANPERFFITLRELNMSFIAHSFPDHYAFKESDICFNDQRKVVMTEKDGVKCQSFCDERIYVLEIIANLPKAVQSGMLEQLYDEG